MSLSLYFIRAHSGELTLNLIGDFKFGYLNHFGAVKATGAYFTWNDYESCGGPGQTVMD